MSHRRLKHSIILARVYHVTMWDVNIYILTSYIILNTVFNYQFSKHCRHIATLVDRIT